MLCQRSIKMNVLLNIQYFLHSFRGHYFFPVNQKMKPLSAMIPRTVFIPQNGDDVSVIQHIVKAEPVPFFFRYQRIDFDVIICPGPESNQTRYYEVNPLIPEEK